jgi:quercetin dioxygenase-like cupin family protein
MARSGHFLANRKMTRSGDAAASASWLHWRLEVVIMNVRRLIGVGVLVALATGAGLAQSHGVIQSPAEAKWGPAPPMLPPGAQIAVVSGDPGKAAPYTVRLKFPANYEIQAHSHPTDENVTVVSGQFFVGMGDKMDKTAGKGVGPGSFVLAPANMNHFAFTKAETTIFLYGMGPVEFKYVNPNDDPRNKK